jgi:hypothetical protein
VGALRSRKATICTRPTRPGRQVRIADEPMLTCVPVYGHWLEPCTPPDEITAGSASVSYRTSGRYWRATGYYVFEAVSAGTGSSCSSFAPMSARRVVLETFPIWVRGSASMSSSRSGHLYFARPAASR